MIAGFDCEQTFSLSTCFCWRSRQDLNLHIVSDYWQFSKLLPYQLGLLLHIAPQDAYLSNFKFDFIRLLFASFQLT